MSPLVMCLAMQVAAAAVIILTISIKTGGGGEVAVIRA